MYGKGVKACVWHGCLWTSDQYLEVELHFHVLSEARGVVVADGGGIAKRFEDGIGEHEPVADAACHLFVRGIVGQKLQHFLGGFCRCKGQPLMERGCTGDSYHKSARTHAHTAQHKARMVKFVCRHYLSCPLPTPPR